jgi:HD-like signal output (HDOD) protein
MSAIPLFNETYLISAAEIVRELHQIPSAPKVLPRLSHLLDDGNSSIEEIVSLIRLDPGIAARVLQMANSVFFSKGSRVYSVDEAVSRVGYDSVYELVAYAVSSPVVNRSLAVYALDAEDIWRQSIACALAAETLASVVGEDRNIAYTVGLLHCVGMVAINEWALQHQPVLVFTHRGMPREYVESERSLLGFTQAEAGAELLEYWDFPHTMTNPVRWQYTPHASISHVRMSALLHVAKWIRSYVCGEGLAPQLPDSSAMQPLRLHTGQLLRIAGEVRLRLLAVRHLLELS